MRAQQVPGWAAGREVVGNYSGNRFDSVLVKTLIKYGITPDLNI
jgi:hypothetical protein